MSREIQLKIPLVLASSSLTRLDLLKQIYIKPQIIVSPDINESIKKLEKPHIYSLRIAKEKALKYIDLYKNHLILSGDTIIVCGTRIIPKTTNKAQAIKNLTLLSGRRHRVYSSICLINPDKKISTRKVLTFLKFKRLTTQTINSYIEQNTEWHNKSGSYSINGFASTFLERINGSYSAVLGMPLCETYKLLLRYIV